MVLEFPWGRSLDPCRFTIVGDHGGTDQRPAPGLPVRGRPPRFIALSIMQPETPVADAPWDGGDFFEVFSPTEVG